MLLITSCGGAKNNSQERQQSLARGIFASSITEFRVRVVYEVGAEPYVGNTGLVGTTWDITKTSLQNLFQNHPGRTVSVPVSYAGMTEIMDQERDTWSRSQLVDLGKRFGSAYVSSSAAVIAVIFLNGTYDGDDRVIGLHITGNPFVFVFKDVAMALGNTDLTRRYVEQATVVHELGHAIGLINNGVPMVTPHEDGLHPAHTTDTNCVMHWNISSTNNILAFVSSAIAGSRTNLFGTNSLADARAFHP